MCICVFHLGTQNIGAGSKELVPLPLRSIWVLLIGFCYRFILVPTVVVTVYDWVVLLLWASGTSLSLSKDSPWATPPKESTTLPLHQCHLGEGPLTQRPLDDNQEPNQNICLASCRSWKISENKWSNHDAQRLSLWCKKKHGAQKKWPAWSSKWEEGNVIRKVFPEEETSNVDGIKTRAGKAWPAWEVGRPSRGGGRNRMWLSSGHWWG